MVPWLQRSSTRRPLCKDETTLPALGKAGVPALIEVAYRAELSQRAKMQALLARPANTRQPEQLRIARY